MTSPRHAGIKHTFCHLTLDWNEFHSPTRYPNSTD